jgi:hypothetical protein
MFQFGFSFGALTPLARWNAKRQAVEFGVEIGAAASCGSRGECFSACFLSGPLPSGVSRRTTLQLTRFEGIAERKLPRRQLTENGIVEIGGRDLGRVPDEGGARSPAGGDCPNPRRSRANLRPPSRSVSVIDRLPKNQNPLENRNNLRSSSPHPGPGQTSGEPRRNFAVRNSSTREPWLFRSPVFGSSIRRLDGEAVGGRPLARTPPRRVTRWLATSIIAPPA